MIVEEDPTACVRASPQYFIQTDKKHPSQLKSLSVSCDLQKCFGFVNQFSSFTRLLNTAKVFADESTLGSLVYMIEIVKKAWFFGQVSNSEFSRFVAVVRSLPYLRIFPYVLGCFRLLNVEEIAPEGYNPLVELCTVVLNQAIQQCDVFVPTEMLTYAETYFVAGTKQGRVYILDKLKTNKIFSLRDFWECHLLWSVMRQAKGSDHFSRKSVDIFTLKQIAQDCVGSVVRSAILTMARAGLEKATAQDIILSTLDKFKLDEQNRALALAFLKEYQAEKPVLHKDEKAKFSIDESQIG